MYPLQKFLEFDRFCSRADVGLHMNKKKIVKSPIVPVYGFVFAVVGSFRRLGVVFG